MRILERIEGQLASTNLPLVAITLAAVPCPDTPVILTLHWHGFIREKLVDIEEAEAVSYTPIPSSALQVNDRWRSLVAGDMAAMEAEEVGCVGRESRERPGWHAARRVVERGAECLQAFALSLTESMAISVVVGRAGRR